MACNLSKAISIQGRTILAILTMIIAEVFILVLGWVGAIDRGNAITIVGAVTLTAIVIAVAGTCLALSTIKC